MPKYLTAATLGRAPGFLFNDEVSEEEVTPCARLLVAEGLLTYPVYAVATTGKKDHGRGGFMSSWAQHMEQPDEAGPDVIYAVITADSVESYRPARRYDQCTQLIKVMGCSACPLLGNACLQQYGLVKTVATLNEDAEKEITPTSSDTWYEKASKQLLGRAVGGVTYIPPTKTRETPFQSALRSIYDHDFSEIEANEKAASENAVAGAATRKFKKLECSRCVYKNTKGMPCEVKHVVTCEGPYAPIEDQQKNLLETWDTLVDRFLTTNEYTRGQFWAVAMYAGIENKVNRKTTLLAGWSFRKDFSVKAFRSRVAVQSMPVDGTNYGALRAQFPELPGTTHLIETPPDDIRAMFYLSLEKDRVSRRSGWGKSQRFVVTRRVDRDGVYLRLASDRYVYYYGDSLKTLGEVYDWLDARPAITLNQLSQGQT